MTSKRELVREAMALRLEEMVDNPDKVDYFSPPEEKTEDIISTATDIYFNTSEWGLASCIHAACWSVLYDE